MQIISIFNEFLVYKKGKYSVETSITTSIERRQCKFHFIIYQKIYAVKGSCSISRHIIQTLARVFFPMAFMKKRRCLLVIFLSTCVVGSTIVHCRTCSLDDPSYKYCHIVKPEPKKGRSYEIEKTVSIYQCRDQCDRQSCEAFEYHVNMNDKLNDCKLFFGHPRQFELSKDTDCNEKQWTYSWLREGKGKLWEDKCSTLTGEFPF